MNCNLKAIENLYVPRENAQAAVDALNAVDVTELPYAEREAHDDEPDPAQRAVLTFGFSLSGSGYGTSDLAWPRYFEVGGLYADFCDDAEVEAMLKALAPHVGDVGVVVLIGNEWADRWFAFVVAGGQVRRVDDVRQEVEVTYEVIDPVAQGLEVRGWL